MHVLLASGGTNTVSTVTEALTTSLQGAGSDLLGLVSSIVPVVIPVMIAIVAVRVGIRVFKSVAGK